MGNDSQPLRSNAVNMNCRYCALPIEDNAIIAPSYWQGLPMSYHAWCKDVGVKQEAFDCQCIDADCNDCRHFKRGEVVKRMLSCMEDGKSSMRLVNMGIVRGHCLKFDKPTEAYPNKWTGRECFEHRRA